MPSQHALVERFSIARETIKAALRKLQDGRLIVTRQGSGAFVRANTERPGGAPAAHRASVRGLERHDRLRRLFRREP